MAPDIPKVDPDRHLDPAAAAWNFRDEVLRWLLHGHSLSDPKDLLIPFFGKFLRSYRNPVSGIIPILRSSAHSETVLT
jgi:hypothetical protein